MVWTLLAAVLSLGSTCAQAALQMHPNLGSGADTVQLKAQTAREQLSIRCNISRWDMLCPPLPSQPATCFACCEEHKSELLAMHCEGPLPNWNYSWSDHCAGKPPPPYLPPKGCTGPEDPTSQCGSNFGGDNHACPTAAQPICSGFVPSKAWGHCCAGQWPPGPPPPGPFTLSKLGATKTFDGLGAISGGGATSRLLVDYPSPQVQ